MEHLDNKKCYSCGKKFRTPSDLLKHKSRKTPCIIMDIKPENINNPNRCKYCNRTFTTRNSLDRHYIRSCKIKNGGMEILVEKVMYDDLVKQNQNLMEQNRILLERMDTIEDKISKLTLDPIVLANSNQVSVNNGVINNGVMNNNNNQTNNFNMNPYTNPCFDKVQVSADDIASSDSISKLLFALVYCNLNVPENHSIYLRNKGEHHLINYDGGRWNAIMGAENVDRIVDRLNNIIIPKGQGVVNGPNGPYGGTDKEFLKLPGAIQESLIRFNTSKDLLNRNSMYEVLIDRNDIIAETIKKHTKQLT